MFHGQTTTEPLQENSSSHPTTRRRALRRLWRAEVSYSAGLLAFAVLAVVAHSYAHFGWDVTVQQWIRHTPPPGFADFMRFVSIPGDGKTPHIIAVLTALFFLLMRLRSEAAGVLLSTIGSGLINMAIKIFVARPRPVPEPGAFLLPYTGNSFPSGHVTFYVCYFGFLYFVADALLPRGSLARRLAPLFVVIPVPLIGLSRVYLFAHWPSDTLGAYLLGGLWLAFSLDTYRRWKARRDTFRAG